MADEKTPKQVPLHERDDFRPRLVEDAVKSKDESKDESKDKDGDK